MTDDDAARYEDHLRAELRAALERDRADEPAPSRDPSDEPAAAEVVWHQPATSQDPPDEPAAAEDAWAQPARSVAVDDMALPYAVDDDDDEPERERRHSKLQSSLEWAAVVIGALVVALVVKTFLFQAFYIPSASMEPTLEQGDRVLVNKVSYDLHDVNRGDVVVFALDKEDVGPDGIKDLIKRVIGLPGDVIESRDGVVYVNDRALEEPYLADGVITGDPDDPKNPSIERQTVPDGHVFVLGDNRSNSADSRYPYRGTIPIDSIVGRAFVLVWPPGEIASL